jgi:FkbM family methyltransferase
MKMLIDNLEYDTDEMPVEARTNISLVQFIDQQIHTLQQQRTAYYNSLIESLRKPVISGPFVLFDVGANFGTDSLHKTLGDPNIRTWAFEPTPELINFLTTSSQDFKDRYNIVPVAVSDFDGTAQFNIADSPGCDWGCSSLNTFNEGLDKTWPGRTDFKFNRAIDVKVMRLDTWFRETNPGIERIDFFHCDTQGSDLKVLQGMGDYLGLIQAGEVECASNEQGKLYKENHTLDDMRVFLEANGFEITAITPNDVQHNEVNVAFRKRAA